MVESAVEQFQTAEQVISQSYPLGQSPPHLSTMEKGAFPLLKFLQSICMRKKKSFFSLKQKKK